jgi:hypothetical protein
MAKTIDQLTALAATPDAADEFVINDGGVTKKITATNVAAAAWELTGNKSLADTSNIVLGTGTGSKIGTATTQKLGFYNATPVDQPALTADLLDSLQEVGLIASGAGNTPLNLSSGALTCGAITCGAVNGGAITCGAVNSGEITATGFASVASTGAITTNSTTSGIGYATGAGSTVTQATSRSQPVTINRLCGSITMVSAAGQTTAVTFTVNNSTVAATDVIIVNQRSGTNTYDLLVTAVAAGSFNITFRSTGGTATDAPVINFAVIKSVTS